MSSHNPNPPFLQCYAIPSSITSATLSFPSHNMGRPPFISAGVCTSLLLLLLIPFHITGYGLVPLCPSSRFRLTLSFGIHRVTRNAHQVNLCATTMIQKKANRCGSSAAIPPSVIIGGGRIGLALKGLGSGGDVVIGRGQNFPSEPSDGPIYVSDDIVVPLSRVLWQYRYNGNEGCRE